MLAGLNAGRHPFVLWRLPLKFRKQLFFYILLAVLMIIDVYSIFNAGNPASLIRPIVPDPGWDFLITAVISVTIALIVIIMNKGNSSSNDPVFLSLIENRAYIEKLREKGKTDQEIAFSFIQKLNENELIKKIAYRKALKYLKRI